MVQKVDQMVEHYIRMEEETKEKNRQKTIEKYFNVNELIGSLVSLELSSIMSYDSYG